MKRSFSILSIVLLFVLGAGICLYPSAASFINAKNKSRIIENAESEAEGMPDDALLAERASVIAYNKSLLDSHIVLTDPFDPDAFPFTDGKYEELLAISDAMASIEIPKINVKLPIYHSTDESVLSNGVGHLENTSLPMGGESTHTVLSAHTGLPSQKLFTDLDILENGDVFYITVLNETLSYKVDQIRIVEPNDTSNLMIERGKDLVTLITCTPYGKNTHRLLVRGVRIENEEAREMEAVKGQALSFTEKLLAKYGISLRELIVFISIPVLTAVFISALFITKKRRGPNHAKKNI